MKSENRLNERTDFIVRILLIAVAVFVLLLVLAKFFYMRTAIDGHSMYPTLDDKELVIVNKNIYKHSDPQRFDIVVFATPISKTGNYVKRIIGLPGETVRIDDNGVIYINDEVLEEEYGYEQIMDPSRARMGVTLGEDEYFVMGDNRNHSEDSRFPLVGNIKKSRFLGKATIRIWPLNKFGYIDLYMERTNDK